MNLTSISEIKALFEKHNFSFTKSLGQNFLINPHVCPKIAEMGGAHENTGVIEVGTGIGVLTRELALRCKKVVAIELDKSLRPVLDDTLSEFDNIDIIFDDILKVDLQSVINRYFNGMNVIVCANLPYYITSPVIMRFLEEKLPVKSVTVMVQKEAAARICALPGVRECGALSIAVRYYSTPKKLFDVKRTSFIPSPNVDSTVIRLDLNKPPITVQDEKLFFKIVSACFSQRRKQIINPLSAELNIPKEKLAKILADCGVSQTVRAESLTIEEFAIICNSVYKWAGC